MKYELFSDIIVEAQNYNQMFSKIYDIFEMIKETGYFDFKREEYIRTDIEENISWARTVLKKNDRIVWFLRLIKFHWLERLNEIVFNIKPENFLEISKILKTEIDIAKQKTNVGSYREYNLGRITRSLEHFLSLPVQKIQNYVWKNESPSNLLDIFTEYEREWQEERTDRGVEIRDGDTLLIPFEGGSKAWWLLARGACRDEADAMGHCGNVPSQEPGDRILSFRLKSDNNLWTPKLTFILHKNGYLGEMKGRANEKPASRYHPYIIELLKNDLIKGIRGGGYAAENNFSLDDLPDNIRENLVDKKPTLGSLKDLIKKLGENNELVIERIKNILKDSIGFKSYNSEENYFVITVWKNSHVLVDDHGNDTAKWISDIVSGNRDLDWTSYDIDDRTIKDFLETVVYKEKKEKKNYSTETKIKEWLAENEPFDPETDDWIDYVIDNDVSQVINAARWAIDDGHRAGAESAMYKDFRRAVTDYAIDGDMYIGDLKFTRSQDGSIDLFDKIELIITPKDLFDVMKREYFSDDVEIIEYLNDVDNDRYFDSELKIIEPRYGYDGYDEDAAIERFGELLDEEL